MTQQPEEGMNNGAPDQVNGAGSSGSDGGSQGNSNLNELILTLATVFVLFVGLGPYFFPPGSPGAIFVGCALLAIICITISVILRKRNPWTAVIAVVAAVLVIAGAVVKRNSLLHGISPESSRYSIVIKEPSQSRYGGPLSEVPCIKGVSGTAHIPEGDALVIANKPENGPTWFFQKVGSLAGDTWLEVVRFSDAGKPFTNQVFYLLAFAMPASAVPGDSWNDHKLPSPITLSYLEQIKRSKSNVGCPLRHR